ncbi:MAG: hypothetical protein Q9216_005738 [Gyalolechia sp. 2 TL-2023]
MAYMKFLSVCLIGFVSLTIATPLNHRRQETETMTATVTLSGAPDAATYSAEPMVPVLPSDIQSLGSVTASPASTGVTADPSSPPDAYSTSEVQDPCQVFCETVTFSQDVCLENCQVIDGNAQINAPGKTFPPNDRAAASTATPSPSPTTTPPADPPEQCKEFCKSNNIPESTCLSNCQVIDGQVQVNAPGKAFPPVRQVTAPSTAAAGNAYGNCMESCLVSGQIASEAGSKGDSA